MEHLSVEQANKSSLTSTYPPLLVKKPSLTKRNQPTPHLKTNKKKHHHQASSTQPTSTQTKSHEISQNQVVLNRSLQNPWWHSIDLVG